MPRSLPDGLECYRQTPSFTEQTVPAALLGRHNTKAGVWGRLVVTGGQLDYIEDEQPPLSLRAGDAVVIAPQVWHRVEPRGVVAFHVEFYRPPSAS